MTISQKIILDSLKRSTAPQEWQIEHKSATSLRGEGYAKVTAGDFSGIVGIIGASLFEDGHGSCYSADHELVNEDLDINDDLDTSVKKYLNTLEN